MTASTPDDLLSRPDASAAVDALGWRLVLATFLSSWPVGSLAEGLSVAGIAATACGRDADEHLRADVRADRVELAVVTERLGAVTGRDAALVTAITSALAEQGFEPAPPSGGRPVQALEIAIDALDIPAIRPFWRAVMAYADEPMNSAPDSAVVDPTGQGPAIWFQQMDEPRPQRNRIHFDISVAHDEAEGRIAAALAAGGVLVSDAAARAFWILADSEGNEICVCTWQDRERRSGDQPE